MPRWEGVDEVVPSELCDGVGLEFFRYVLINKAVKKIQAVNQRDTEVRSVRYKVKQQYPVQINSSNGSVSDPAVSGIRKHLI